MLTQWWSTPESGASSTSPCPRFAPRWGRCLMNLGRPDEHRVPEGQKAYSMTKPIRIEHLKPALRDQLKSVLAEALLR